MQSCHQVVAFPLGEFETRLYLPPAWQFGTFEELRSGVPARHPQAPVWRAVQLPSLGLGTIFGLFNVSVRTNNLRQNRGGHVLTIQKVMLERQPSTRSALCGPVRRRRNMRGGTGTQGRMTIMDYGVPL